MSIELPPLRRFSQDFHRARAMPNGPWCFYDEVEARERILLARIAELEADAKRYRWIASRARKDTAYDRYENGAYWSIVFFADDGRHALDAAIDAARSKE